MFWTHKWERFMISKYALILKCFRFNSNFYTDYTSWFSCTKCFNNRRSYMQSSRFWICTWYCYIENIWTQEWRQITDKVSRFKFWFPIVDIPFVVMWMKWKCITDRLILFVFHLISTHKFNQKNISCVFQHL